MNANDAKAKQNKRASKEIDWQDRLSEIRLNINAVDLKLLTLLNQRAVFSKEVGEIKKQQVGLVLKPQREKELLQNLELQNEGILPNEHLQNIWREILSSSRMLQRPQKVAYLGPEGTFSYYAGLEYLGKAVEYLPCKDLQQVFHVVNEKQCELGIIPLENSLQGSIGQSFDLFVKYNLQIQAETYSKISHCLLSTLDSLAQVETVYSHPQPLAQCDSWLRAMMPSATLVPVESTSAAAHKAYKLGNAGHKVAAIGHHKLADLYNLNILARSIEDEPDNWTRFALVALPSSLADMASICSTQNCEDNIKTSTLFTLPDKAGALAAVLQLFSENNVNMRKLESRPLKGHDPAAKCWRYAFFVDVECNLGQKKYAELINKLHNICDTFRILGVYPFDKHEEYSLEEMQ